jgi:hypothetical protein
MRELTLLQMDSQILVIRILSYLLALVVASGISDVNLVKSEIQYQ